MKTTVDEILTVYSISRVTRHGIEEIQGARAVNSEGMMRTRRPAARRYDYEYLGETCFLLRRDAEAAATEKLKKRASSLERSLASVRRALDRVLEGGRNLDE